MKNRNLIRSCYSSLIQNVFWYAHTEFLCCLLDHRYSTRISPKIILNCIITRRKLIDAIQIHDEEKCIFHQYFTKAWAWSIFILLVSSKEFYKKIRTAPRKQYIHVKDRISVSKTVEIHIYGKLWPVTKEIRYMWNYSK